MFKIGDTAIYLFIVLIIGITGLKAFTIKEVAGTKVEVYVAGKLNYVDDLSLEKKERFIDTELGGIKMEFIDNKVRVISSNSPKKLIVKQGFISKAGETLIGVPDKVIVKIVGDSDLDYIIK